MKPIKTKETNFVFGLNQPGVQPLPVCYPPREMNPTGQVISCWKLEEEEILKLIETGELWLSVETFHRGLQPVYLTVNKNDLFVENPKQ